MTDLLQRNGRPPPLSGAPIPDKTRRLFLMFGAGAVGAAAAPVLAAPAAIVGPVDIGPKSLGYQETAHVRAYYATTRI